MSMQEPAPNPTAATSFEPARFLSRVNGSEYLEVKWRLVWLRDRHPDAHIETEMITLHDDWAVFRATVRIPGGGMATGYGQEKAADFRDFIEKAETKSIGRALAALGFGTQFCPDHDFGAAQGRVVDSPVQRRERPQPAQGQTRAPGNQQQGQGEPPTPIREAPVDQREAENPQAATQRQLRYLQAVAREAGYDPESLDARAIADYGVPPVQLNRRDCSALIDLLQAEAGNTGQ